RDARQRRVASRINTVADAQRLARRRVPRPVFDYIEGGAGSESTVRANQRAVEAVQFRPRVGQTAGVPGPDLATTVLGTPVAMPLLLSPVGFTRMMDPRGDVAGARAATAAGTIFTLSSMSGHTIDEVARAADTPPWFQLYFLGGRPGAEQLVERAKAAGYAALVVTLDTQVPGNRERDLRYGLSPPLELNRRTAMKMAPHAAWHPRWLADLAADRFRLDLVNATSLELDHKRMSAAEALMHWLASPPRWEDFTWLREHFDGPVIAKGVLTGDDARRAVDCGVSAIVVSNHGGRQLDGVPATMTALVEVLDAVGTDVEVFVDGGFRRGADVVKAVAVGARAVMVGRPWAYGLAAAGEPGVKRVLSVLRDDVDRTLRLLGVSSITDLDRELVDMPSTS
ncbi:MAG: alpha-hydroxy-acid oxidizing protein, partial [Actinomycetota bacterium]|nr:alpha-hydroxy-acid oxidizing protein [Actinomycetota bacterium]